MRDRQSSESSMSKEEAQDRAREALVNAAYDGVAVSPEVRREADRELRPGGRYARSAELMADAILVGYRPPFGQRS